MILEQAALTHDIERIFRSKKSEKTFQNDEGAKQHMAPSTSQAAWTIVVALRNQYVTVGGKVKRQTRGLAQGKADAVRLSALVLSFYEMTFVLRCCHRWTAEKIPQGVRMMCLHSQRMVDDSCDLWLILP